MIYSKQRELLVSQLRRYRGHPTADVLYASVRSENPTISLATVYRNLNQLVDSGIVMRISVPGQADRFDDKNDGHQHMLCTECGGITDIPASALPDVCGTVSDNTGLHVSACNMIFYGLCKACEKKSQKNN
ncbi:MAG: transcriptional repressor [Clostridiaceae bacterium]|nr:transcriptional repressor [Eubacteriales bacterium]